MTVNWHIMWMAVEIYTIQEIAKLTGMSRRKIRYYIEMKLVDPPSGKGRGSFYNEQHLNRLLLIGKLRAQGQSLPVISGLIDMYRTDAGRYLMQERRQL